MTAGLDEFYTYDPLNRLTEMQRGVLNGTKTGITGTPSREMDCTLDPTGNWSAYLTKTSGTTDLNQTRTSNTVNEITAIAEHARLGDPAGLRCGGEHDQHAAAGQPHQRLHRRLRRLEPDGRRRQRRRLGGNVPVRRPQLPHREDSRQRPRRPGTSTSPATGRTSRSASARPRRWTSNTCGAMRYIDELVCRDDATPQRLYACQDANFNLTTITDASGLSSSGICLILRIQQSLTIRGRCSLKHYSWIMGFQGLAYNEPLGLLYNRARDLFPTFGRFSQRDPLEYTDGGNLYEYEGSYPTHPTSMLQAQCYAGSALKEV